MRKRFLLVLTMVLSLALPFGAGAQSTPSVQTERQERFASWVDVPTLTGLDNQFVQDSINRTLLNEGGISGYLATLNGLSDAQGSGIQVDVFTVILPAKEGPGVLAVGIDAGGRIGPGRPGHRLTPLNFDLATGQVLTAAEIFTDPAEAEAAISQTIEEELMPEMSSYADASGLLPLPADRFLLDEAGITFHYDSEQLTLLSGKAGAVNFHYDELSPLLNLEDGAVLSKLGVPALLEPVPESRRNIEAACAAGRLPGLPVSLADKLSDVLDAYPLLVDSEGFPGGSKYLLEDARMRGTVLIAGAGDEEGLVGILSGRINLYGLITGKATLEQVRAVMGEPLSALDIDEAAALSYGLEAGVLESYACGGYGLDMAYRADGVLQAVWLRTDSAD